MTESETLPYKFVTCGKFFGIIKTIDGSWIHPSLEDQNYRMFCAYLAGGGKVAPADPAPICPTYIPKLIFVDRMIQAGNDPEGNSYFQKAMTLVESNPITKCRWNAAIEISPDDVEVQSMLIAIGLDPSSILSLSI